MRGVWIAVAVAGAGTFAMRSAFLVLAHRLPSLPPSLARALHHVPSAALAALVVPAIVRPDGQLDLVGPRVLVGLVAVLIAWRTRSVTLTMVVGVVLLIMVEAL